MLEVRPEAKAAGRAGRGDPGTPKHWEAVTEKRPSSFRVLEGFMGLGCGRESEGHGRLRFSPSPTFARFSSNFWRASP